MALKEVIKKELIGCEAEIVASKNKSLVGAKGKITNETKHMITISNEKERQVIKDQSTFLINIDGKKYKINGKILVGRPEDRLKKVKI